MNSVPTILTQDGFEVDNNGLLTELVVPHTVDTLKVPTKVVFNGDTLNWIPSNATSLLEFEAPNMTSIVRSGNLFVSYSVLTKISFPAVTSIAISSGALLRNCDSVTDVNLPAVQSITHNASSNGFIYNCNSLTSLVLPSLESITISAGSIINSTTLTTFTADNLQYITTSSTGGVFSSTCNSLTTLNLPKIKKITATTSSGYGIGSPTNYSLITLGSTGNPVESLGTGALRGSTQSGLHIVVYVADPQNPIANAPWGATNASYEFLQA